MHRAAPVVVALALVVGGCSSGSDAELNAPSSTVKGETTTAPSSPGKGSLVLGGFPYAFTVTGCQQGPAADEPAGAQTLFRLDGSGETFQDEPFTVKVLRFQTERGATTTVTDTIDVVVTGAKPRQSQAQRIEVNGQITDLRDPKAAAALLRIDGGHVQAQGTFGPADATATTRVTGTLDAMCPGGGS